MAVPTLLLTPEESRTRTGPLMVSPSGATRIVSGHYGQAWFLEEGTTNYLRNPSAEVDLTAISATDAGTTLIRDTAFAHVGATSVRLDTDGTAAGQGVRYETATGLNIAANTKITGSVYVRADGVPLSCQLLVVYTDGTDSGAAVPAGTVTATTTWTRVATTYTVPAGKTVTRAVLTVATTGSGSAVTFWADAAQVEPKAYTTSYADGSLGTGYAWTGTAHASASTRAAGGIAVDPPSGLTTIKGTAIIRFMRPNMAAASGAPRLFNWGGYGHAGGDHINMTLSPQGAVGAGTTTNGTPSSGLAVPGHAGGITYTASARWTSDTIALRTDIGSREVPRTVSPIGAVLLDDVLRFGRDVSTQFLNGQIESVAVYDRALSDAEVQNLMTMPARWTWPALMPRIGGLIRTVPAEPLALTRTYGEVP